jgi:hypothetical protein
VQDQCQIKPERALYTATHRFHRSVLANNVGATTEIKMNASRLYLPTLGNRTEIEAVLAGLRPELYRRMLREISAQLRLARDLG